MGFRVGHQCFASESDAEDYFYSQQSVIPVIADHPTYMVFHKNGDGWLQNTYVNNQLVYSVNAPARGFSECSPAEEFASGAGVGLAMMAVLALVWGYRQIGGFFSNDH